MRIDLEKVREVQAVREQIDAVPLEDVELYSNGERVAIPKDIIANWKYARVTTFDFLARDGFKVGYRETDSPYLQLISLTDPTTQAQLQRFSRRTRALVQQMVDLRAQGKSYAAIAAELDIATSTVAQVFKAITPAPLAAAGEQPTVLLPPYKRGRPRGSRQQRYMLSEVVTELRPTVLELHAAGCTMREITALLGISRSTQERIRRMSPRVTPAPRKQPWARITRAALALLRPKIISLHGQGLSQTAIAAQCDVNVDTVRRVLRAEH